MPKGQSQVPYDDLTHSASASSRLHPKHPVYNFTLVCYSCRVHPSHPHSLTPHLPVREGKEGQNKQEVKCERHFQKPCPKIYYTWENEHLYCTRLVGWLSRLTYLGMTSQCVPKPSKYAEPSDPATYTLKFVLMISSDAHKFTFCVSRTLSESKLGL